MNAWAVLDGRRKLFAVAAAVVVLASDTYAVILYNVYFGAQTVTAIDDVGEAVAAALAAAACAWAANRATGKDRLGWGLMGVSAGLWSAGEVVWSIYEVGLGVEVPYPSLADAGFLLAVPFAVAGIRAFWGEARGTSSRWRVWFDGVIVAIALTSTAWGFGLREVWRSGSPTVALDLAYPLSDILIGTVLILAIRRATQQQKGRMALLLAGIACYSVADSAFAYLTAAGTFGSVGSVLDTGWFAGFLFIALAAICPDAPAKAAAAPAPLDLWQVALPWMTLLTASAADLYTVLSGHEGSLFQISMTGILALLLTINMLFERREFLEMLNEIEESHATLKDDFQTALVAIKRFSALMRDAERLEISEVHRVAAEIHRDAERLNLMIEELVAEDEAEDVRAGEVVSAGSTR
jgi:hypothetical protein